MSKMNPKVKKMWVEALRSGKYKQGEGELHNVENNTHCCLGVLCDLHAKVMKKKSFNKDGEYLNEGETLPLAVSKWAGISDEDGPLDNPTIGKYCATDLNDNHGKTFEEIANLIDKHL